MLLLLAGVFAPLLPLQAVATSTNASNAVSINENLRICISPFLDNFCYTLIIMEQHAKRDVHLYADHVQIYALAEPADYLPIYAPLALYPAHIQAS
ncbi:hypothetical protein J40TS1_35440 [Paenibacillus montaniterrae]|uniref:Uncharacterized protein n=1 Tax=Paenibacillus montaniterrae TaxID=429341 RepID=A0A920CVA3_9BACL|nr:hypothetical protein J40TS1_35440 [Paenibacillus montaniterrae]